MSIFLPFPLHKITTPYQRKKEAKKKAQETNYSTYKIEIEYFQMVPFSHPNPTPSNSCLNPS